MCDKRAANLKQFWKSAQFIPVTMIIENEEVVWDNLQKFQSVRPLVCLPAYQRFVSILLLVHLRNEDESGYLYIHEYLYNKILA